MKKSKSPKRITFNQAYSIALAVRSIGSETVLRGNANTIMKRVNSLLRMSKQK